MSQSNQVEPELFAIRYIGGINGNPFQFVVEINTEILSKSDFKQIIEDINNDQLADLSYEQSQEGDEEEGEEEGEEEEQQ